MSILVSFRGVNYTVPEPSDAFTQSLTDYLAAIATGLGLTQPFLEATTAAGQSIPNNTSTVVVFGTVVTDTDSAYNSGTGRYTVPTGKGGRYFISTTIAWNASGVGASANQFAITAFKNAVQVQNLDNEVLTPGTTFSAFNSLAGSTVINCAAGDILDVRATQTSGGAIALQPNALANRLTIHRLPS